MATCKVKWFNKKKGYGFFCSDHRFKFIHENVEVDFDIEKTQHGLQAGNVCENFLYNKKKHFVQKLSC